jgi:hypothetical protein
MIRVPLNFHAPETIYSFLKQNVGPLYMVIKKRQAIIYFSKPDNAEKALEKYGTTTIGGMPAQLLPYKDGDLDRISANGTDLQAGEGVGGNLNEAQVPPSAYSEFTKLIEEGLKIKETDNPVETIIKRNRKEVVEFVSSFDGLFTTANNKKIEIENVEPEESLKAEKINQFEKYLESSLSGIARNLKKDFRMFRRACGRYGQREEVEIEPAIVAAPPKAPRVRDKDKV